MSQGEIGPHLITASSAALPNFTEAVTPEFETEMDDVTCKTAFESDESEVEEIAFETESEVEQIAFESESEVEEIAFESDSEIEAIAFEYESEVEETGFQSEESKMEYLDCVCPLKRERTLHTEEQCESKDISEDAEWKPVNSCCPQNCLNSVDEKTIGDLKLEFKKDIKLETKRHLLIHFRKQCDFGLGLKAFHWKKQTICFKAFSEKTGISTYLIQCVRRDQMNGTVRYVHGNKSTVKTSSASIRCISFVISYCDIFGQNAPDEETIVIPSHIKIKEVYKAYTAQIMKPHIKLSTFYQLLVNSFGPNRYDRSLPHIRFSEYSTHSRCNTCVVLDKLQRTVKKEEELKYVQALKFKHRQRFGQARQTISNIVQLAITFPDNNLFIKIDDMDNSKSYLPHAEEPGKVLSNLFRLPTKVTGTITISSRYPCNRSVDFFLNHSQFENGSNKVVTILFKLLVNHANRYEILPSNLHLNLDNCAKENKNKFLFAFLAVLILYDIFQEITVNYMLVGHTGNDVDQLFSILAPQFMSEISTLEDLHNLITESPIVPKPTCQNLEYIHDWKSFISPFLNPLSQHSFFHSFQIKKEKGDVKFRAKKYPQDPEYFPPTGISLLKDNIDLQPVPAADFRVETLELDRVFRDLNKYIEQQSPLERVKIRESWDNLRENLEKMPRRQKFLPKLDILELPKQTLNPNLLLSHHLLPPIDDEDLPELRGEEFPAELNIGDFEREVLVKMDVVLYTKTVKSRPWVGRVIELLPDGKFVLQWYSRKSRGNTFYAMQNNGKPYTAVQSASMVMFWEMSDNKTKDSFQLSKRWMDKIMAEYSAIDETE